MLRCMGCHLQYYLITALKLIINGLQIVSLCYTEDSNRVKAFEVLEFADISELALTYL